MVGPGEPAPSRVPPCGQDPSQPGWRSPVLPPCSTGVPPNASRNPRWWRPRDDGRCGWAMGSPRCLWAQASQVKGPQWEMQAIGREAGSALGTAGDPPAQTTAWAKPLAQASVRSRDAQGPRSSPTVLARKADPPGPGLKHRALGCRQNGLGTTGLRVAPCPPAHPAL